MSDGDGRSSEVAAAADPKLAQLDDPIVGTDVKVWDANTGQGARGARAMPEPKAPTPAAAAKHRLTHLPCLLVPNLRRE